MNKILKIYFLLVIVLLFSCNKSSKRQADPLTESIQKENVAGNIQCDEKEAKARSYWVSVGNDAYPLTISQIRDGFELELIKKRDTLFKNINIDTLLVYGNFEGFATNLSLENLNLVDINYKYIRSNTLYFTFLIMDIKSKEKTQGTFNLFYRTEKIGQVYGVMVNAR